MFPLYDKASGGGLEKQLRTWRRQGWTYVDISYELRDSEIAVDPSTVRRWCVELDIPNPEKIAR